MELSEEQLARIEQNKALALRRLEEARKRAIIEAQIAASTEFAADGDEKPETVLACCHKFSDDSTCRSNNIDRYIYENFEEIVCKSCAKNNSSYDLLSKTECAAQYLLPEDNILALKYANKLNPHNPGWIPMKLFLRKHAQEASLRRFGSAEELVIEKTRRRDRKLEKEIENASQLFGESITEYNAAVHQAEEHQAPACTSSSKKTKSANKRKRQLMEFVNCIKGTSTW